MNPWRPYPLYRLLIPLLAGIVLEFVLVPGGMVRIWCIAGMLLFLPAILLFIRYTLPYKLRWVPGLVITTFYILSGFQLASEHRITNHPDYPAQKLSGLMLLSVIEPPSATSYGWKVFAEIEFILKEHDWKRVKLRTVAYLRDGDPGQTLQYGDRILIHAAADSILDNSNPHSFSYAGYLKKKSIAHRLFAPGYAWKKCSLAGDHKLRVFAFTIRDRLLDLLREHGVGGEEFAVAGALLLGYTDELSPELMRGYSASGAMHVLSVSGMHVGIIYLFFEMMFGFMERRRLLKWIKAALILLFIWFYALMTGLAPCVFRAAAMITLPIMARALGREASMFNVIAASLLVMVVADPSVLHDGGFQLSYLAVLGLVILYKPIYDLYVTSYVIPDKIWSLLAVSIAAQIATLPVTLYLFHQFPNYFLLTNLVVVPLSSLVIYTGILLISVGSLAMVAAIVAGALSWLIRIMNEIILWIESLPWSVSAGIHITWYEMLLLYGVIAGLFLFLSGKKSRWLLVALTLIILLQVSSVVFRIRRLNDSGMVVYNAKNAHLSSIRYQDRTLILYGFRKEEAGDGMERHRRMLRDDLEARGIKYQRMHWIGTCERSLQKRSGFLPAQINWPFMLAGGHRILFLEQKPPDHLKRRCDIDLLVMTGNYRADMARIVEILSPEMVVFDGMISSYSVKKYKSVLDSLGVAYWHVSRDGAWQKEFSKLF